MTTTWHRLTHKHTHANKVGVGEIQVCRRRFSTDWKWIVAPLDYGPTLWIYGAEPEDLRRLAEAASPEQLRSVAVQLGGKARP